MMPSWKPYNINMLIDNNNVQRDAADVCTTAKYLGVEMLTEGIILDIRGGK